jgi:hypothetical protein
MMRTEITHLCDFARVDVGDGIDDGAIDSYTLVIFGSVERSRARNTCVVIANSVGERGAGKLKATVRGNGGSVRVAEIPTSRPAPVALLVQLWEGRRKCRCRSLGRDPLGAIVGRAVAEHNSASTRKQ